MLKEHELLDAVDSLANNGYTTMRRLRNMENGDVDELGLPRGTAKELKALLEVVRKDDSPAAAGQTQGAPRDNLVSALICWLQPRVVLIFLSHVHAYRHIVHHMLPSCHFSAQEGAGRLSTADRPGDEAEASSVGVAGAGRIADTVSSTTRTSCACSRVVADMILHDSLGPRNLCS